MFPFLRTYRYTPALLCLFAVVCASGCDISSRAKNLTGNAGTPPKVGLRITKVYEGANAERAGLHPMDVITKYGDFDIVDAATYFAARDQYAKSNSSVPLVAWRGVFRVNTNARPGKLGLEFTEYNPVLSEFQSIISKLEAMREIPRYMHEREFKGVFTTPPEKLLAEARTLIDKAAREGTLTPNQVLVSRIFMTFDDAPAEAIKNQSALLEQFLATQPDSYVEYIGHDIFFEKKRYRAAIACFKQHLKTEPDDVTVWLNLGVANNSLGMYDEADAVANYIVEKRMGISSYGMAVLFGVKAEAALGKQDYATAMSIGDRAFDGDHNPYVIGMVLLAAAKAGDHEKLEAAKRKFAQVLPKEFESDKLEIAALDAYVLARANQRDRARQLVMKWKDGDRIEGKVNEWWRKFPGGDEVTKTWKELASS